LDSKNQPETSRDDILIRKFLLGTFHDLFASEIIIKRRLNTINIGFLVKFPRAGPAFNQKLYFLVGYSEELLSNLLKCVVKIQPQTVLNKNDLEFKKW
jgi:small subunit ribosomal protein S24